MNRAHLKAQAAAILLLSVIVALCTFTIARQLFGLGPHLLGVVIVLGAIVGDRLAQAWVRREIAAYNRSLGGKDEP